ncbi:MAG: MotA/TolQ/ExbB proton channel family protein [Myxococcota bacterium]|jgi:flagellar motor component MotA|nr:MotA/TolQ/ExbB proton channel family protein [Myxococcota bacterium]
MASERPGHPIVGSLILCASLFGIFVLEGGAIETLLFPSGIILVVGSILGAVLMGCGLRASLAELWGLLRGVEGDYVALRRALGVVIVVGPLAGSLGTVLGMVHVMANLSDPANIGMGMAVSFIALFYGLLCALIAYGLDVLADRRSVEAPESASPPPDAVGHPVLGSALVLVAIVGIHLFEGGDMGQVMHSGALLLVGGATLGAVLISGGLRESLRQLGALLGGQSMDDVTALRRTLGVVIITAPLAGAMGSVLGMVHVMTHLTDPTRLGIGVALAFIAMIYGGLIAILAFALDALASQRTAGGSPNRSATTQATLFAMLGFFISLTLFMTVLYAVSLADAG